MEVLEWNFIAMSSLPALGKESVMIPSPSMLLYFCRAECRLNTRQRLCQVPDKLIAKRNCVVSCLPSAFEPLLSVLGTW
jgi:hypothetical protein